MLLPFVLALLLSPLALAHPEPAEEMERLKSMSPAEHVENYMRARHPTPKSAGRAAGCQGCAFAFQSPIIPSFDLPAPLAPGDSTLNVGNPIVRADGSPTQGCNGDRAVFLNDDNVWTPFYSGSKRLDGLFYVTGTSLKIRTIQSWQSEVEQALSGRQVRLQITCENVVESCIHFFVHAEPRVDSCDECAGLVNRTEEDARLLALYDFHRIAELVISDLPLTLSTFPEAGSVFFFNAGMGGYPTHGPTGSNSIEDFYGNFVMFGKFFSQSDMVASFLDVEVSDDAVITNIYIEFNHTAPFPAVLPGIAPTNKFVRFNLIVFFKFDVETGLLTQEAAFWDQATILKQIGLIDDPSLPIVDGAFFDKLFDPASGPALNQYAPRK